MTRPLGGLWAEYKRRISLRAALNLKRKSRLTGIYPHSGQWFGNEKGLLLTKQRRSFSNQMPNLQRGVLYLSGRYGKQYSRYRRLLPIKKTSSASASKIAMVH